MAFNTSQGLVLVVTATLSPLQRPQCPEDLRVDINSALLPPSSLPKSLGSVEVLGPLSPSFDTLCKVLEPTAGKECLLRG